LLQDFNSRHYVNFGPTWPEVKENTIRRNEIMQSKHKDFLALLFTAVALLIVMTACGGDNNTNITAPPQSTGTNSNQSNTPVAATTSEQSTAQPQTDAQTANPNFPGVNTTRNTIFAGHLASYIILDDNTLWGWGEVNSRTSIPQPEQISENIVDVATGQDYSMLIDADGNLYVWGRERFREIAAGQNHILFENRALVMSDVVQTSVGNDHSMAITSDGVLWGWGRNHNGQVGVGHVSTGRDFIAEPTQIMENVALVSAGWDFTLAITHDGVLWAWGSNDLGQIGISTETRNQASPARIMDDVIMAVVGVSSAFAITSDGDLWSWGANGDGLLGDGTDVESRYTPTKIMENVVSVSTDSRTAMAIKADETLWGWGSNYEGFLLDAVDYEGNSNQPLPIMENVATVTIGTNHILVITKDGVLRGWGRNHSSQVGGGLESVVLIPFHIMDGVLLP